ncbi:MAG: C-GCAxxG-C-C family protein, partial [Chloroflexota bacterium]
MDTQGPASHPDTVAAHARDLFLDESSGRGCAETAFMVLKEAWGLPDPTLSDAAMALNGGIAYRGGPCGAITGAALALGVLAGSRFDDHREAKT